MRSILNFKENYPKTVNMKAEVNYSESAIDQLISQFLQLGNESEDIEGAFFLKNRSPLMEKNFAAGIRNYYGKECYEDSLIGQELYFHKFPIWRSLAKTSQANQINVLSDSPEPFNLGKDKSFLVSAVCDDKYNWGFLICFGAIDKVWSKQQIQLSISFSELLSTTLINQHKTYKSHLQLAAIHSSENDKTKLINQLKKIIDEKSKIIKKLQDKNSVSRKKSKVINLKNTKECFDEVWLSIQGFKNGEEEPQMSKWEKLSDQNLLGKINQLLHLDKNETKLKCQN